MWPRIAELKPKTSGGDKMHVSCLAQGYPKPSVIWMLGDDVVPIADTITDYSLDGSPYATTKTLVLGEVTNSQHGNVYTCKASNSAGSDKSTFTLAVSCNLLYIKNVIMSTLSMFDLASGCQCVGVAVACFFSGVVASFFLFLVYILIKRKRNANDGLKMSADNTTELREVRLEEKNESTSAAANTDINMTVSPLYETAAGMATESNAGEEGKEDNSRKVANDAEQESHN